MYQNPVLFPPISNRETWLQVIQIADDETGDLISLTSDTGNGAPLYAIYLEISPPHDRGGYNGPDLSWYGCGGDPSLRASLADYITIPDVGTISIEIPYTVMQTLHGGRTYDVYLRLEDAANSDARQLLIGRLPVAYSGARGA